MEKDITILGATGSIGRQTLDVARSLHLPVRALTGNRNVELMERALELNGDGMTVNFPDRLTAALQK